MNFVIVFFCMNLSLSLEVLKFFIGNSVEQYFEYIKPTEITNSSGRKIEPHFYVFYFNEYSTFLII